MSPLRSANSFLDIGRRLNAIRLEYETLEEAQAAMPEGSEEYGVAHVRLVALTDEQTALQDLALVMQPNTLSEVAVQLAVLTDAVTEICVPDLRSLLESGHLETELTKLRRVLAGVTPVVTAVAGPDQTQWHSSEVEADISDPQRPWGEPDQDNRAAPDQSGSEVLSLCSAYRVLNELRTRIDESAMSQRCDELRSGLQPVLVRLGDIVDRLAKTRALHMSELHAKATVLVTLLRLEDAGRCSTIPGEKSIVLAFSLAEDVIGFPE